MLASHPLEMEHKIQSCKLGPVNTRDPCDNGTDLYFDFGGRRMNK